MKYKVLLIGKNQVVIDDFFSATEDIEPLTSSLRWDDIVRHIKYYEPDALCYCAAGEQQEHINQMVSLKIRLEKENIPLVVIGTKEDCNEFKGVKVDLILQKPITASMIEERLAKFIDELRREEEERLEEERQKKEEEQRQREAEQRQREEEQRKKEEKESSVKTVKKAKGGRGHILVIDDDSTMLKAIKEQLRDEYDVATAINGKIARKFLEKKKTDLILLDYEMPGEAGPEVLEKLRENDETKDIPVIFLTGVTEKEKIMQVLSMNPQGYLLKPIDHDKLIAAIRDAIY